MAKPFFSILMPVYNGEKYINKAIDSVLTQTFQNYELIIVNDGSTDNTLKICETYKKKNNQIILINQENSGSANKARIKAIDVAKGNYFVYLDADDYFSKEMLDSYYNVIMKTGAEIVTPYAYRITDDGQILYKYEPFKNAVETIISGKEAFTLSINWEIVGWACYKKELFNNIKIDDKFFNSDELVTRILFSKAEKVGFTNQIYFYRVNENSTTLKKHNPRTYERLETTLALFDYAKEINAEKKALISISNNYLSQIIAMIKLFIQEKKYFMKEQNKLIYNYLKEKYRTIPNEIIWKSKNGKYKILYFASLKCIFLVIMYLKLFHCIKKSFNNFKEK